MLIALARLIPLLDERSGGCRSKVATRRSPAEGSVKNFDEGSAEIWFYSLPVNSPIYQALSDAHSTTTTID